jgi:hypothetical protein
VRQLPGDGVTGNAFAAAPAAPLVRLEDPAGEHGTTGLESLAGYDEAELVEPAELAQVRAGEGSVRQVEVLWMGGVRTSIFRGPRPLHRHRPDSPRYTLNCE